MLMPMATPNIMPTDMPMARSPSIAVEAATPKHI